MLHLHPAFHISRLPRDFNMIILMACVQSTNIDSVNEALSLSHLCDQNLEIAEHDMQTAAQ